MQNASTSVILLLHNIISHTSEYSNPEKQLFKKGQIFQFWSWPISVNTKGKPNPNQ